MSALLALRLVTYLLVGTGVAALYGAALIGPVGAGLVVLAILVGWGHEQARARGAVRPALGYCLVGTAAVAITVDLFYLAYSLLDGMVHLLLFLILLRLFVRRGLRDLRDAALLSFFMLVAAASISFSLSFLAVFVVFLVLGTWMLILNHVVTELEQAGREGAAGSSTRRVFFRGPLTRVSLVAAAITFALAGGLFFIIPRVGQAALPLRAQLGRMVTGFSDRVDLGSFGDIESDQSVVMRVYLTDERVEPADAARAALAGRGLRPVRRQRLVERGGDAPLHPPRRRGRLRDRPAARHRTGPAPGDLPGADGHRRGLRGAPDAAARAPVAHPRGGRHGRAQHLERHRPAALRRRVRAGGADPARRSRGEAGAGLPVAERARYLQLPELSPDVARLAREATAGTRDPETAARRISAFLSTTYRYTLALRRETTRPPLEEFLFVRRSGNCEYFAAAMAVMLRSEGIPSRVVAGFQHGEWNPYGRYFMVRLSDAHSWVEAYIDGRGWVAFDPSPRGEVASVAPGSVSLYLDAARMRWYRYVINWSLGDQVHLAASVHRQATDVRVGLSWPRHWRVSPAVLAAGGAVVVLALAWLFGRRGFARGGAKAAAGVPAFYQRALRLLARRGLSPGAAETARQFAARVGVTAPERAEPFARLTRHYERARFGATALSETEWQDVTLALDTLAAAR